jgi:ABC-type amino acid transport substrate-binding protein
MAVCKGNDALLVQLDAALAGIAGDGTLALLENRWFE